MGVMYNAINPYLHDGRLIMTLFLSICSFCGFSCQFIKFFSWSMAIMCLITSSIIVFNLIHDRVENKRILVLLSVGLVVSPYILEFFFFPEYTGIMCLGLLFVIMSLNYIVRYFDKKNNKYLILSFLSSLLSVLCYQGMISLIFIYPLLFIKYDDEKIIDIVKKIVIIGLNFFVASCFTAMITKIFGASRLGNSVNFVYKIKEVAVSSKNLIITTSGLYPSYLILLLGILSFLIVLIYSIKNKKNNLAIASILIAISVFIVPSLPHLFTSTTWLVPRSCIGFGVLFISMIVFYSMNYNNSIINKSFLTLIILLLCCQWYFGLKMFESQIENTIITKDTSNKIITNIKEYEKRNDIEIKYVKMYQDKNITYINEGIKGFGDVNVRTYAFDWSARVALGYYNGNYIYKTIDLDDEEFKHYCNSNDWSEYSESQIKIVDDIIYICLY